jgi:uncharacterized protein YndB with AHSA1/START domain
MKKATVTAQTGASTIHIEREFDAPKAKLWKAMTTRELIEKWWTGPGYKVRVEEFEPRDGGKWRYVQYMDGSDDKYAFYGVYHEHSADRVVQTFEFSDLPERGHVILERMQMKEIGEGKTLLTVDQSFFSAQDRDGMMASGMEDGMNQTYAKLEELAQSL